MTLVALLVLLIVIESVVIAFTLVVYNDISLGEAWSWTWSKPWFPVAFTLAGVIGSSL